MTDVKRPLPSFTGVGEGQTATVAISGGPTIDEIDIVYPYSVVGGSEFQPDHMTFRFFLGAEAIFELSALEMLMIAAYLGIYTENGRVTIPFKEIAARAFDAVHFTGLVTFPTDAINLEVDILGTGASATVTLAAEGKFSASQPVRKFIPKIKGQSFPVTASGEVDVTTLQRGPRIKRIHFANQYMDNLKILRDTVEIFNQSKTSVDYEAKRNGAVPQANIYHYDPVIDGFILAKMLVTASGSLEIKPNFGAGTVPASVRMLIESVETSQTAAAAGVNTAGATSRRSRRRLRRG